MIAAVITGGPGIDCDVLREIAGSSDIIYCADSGADTAVRAGIPVTKVFGDMDSISSETLEYLKRNNIPLEIYPEDKDLTDTEICIREIPEDAEIMLIMSLTGRIDHVLTNLDLAMRLHGEGRDITATDGVTDVFFLQGDDMIGVTGLIDPVGLSVSLISPDEKDIARGASCEGLYYPFENADIPYGTGHFNSNSIAPGCDAFKVSIKEGKLMVFVTLKGL